MALVIDFCSKDNLDVFLGQDHNWILAPPYNGGRLDDTRLRVSAMFRDVLELGKNKMILFSRKSVSPEGEIKYHLFEPEPIVTHKTIHARTDMNDEAKKIQISVQNRMKAQKLEEIEQLKREIARIKVMITDLHC